MTQNAFDVKIKFGPTRPKTGPEILPGQNVPATLTNNCKLSLATIELTVAELLQCKENVGLNGPKNIGAHKVGPKECVPKGIKGGNLKIWAFMFHLH